MSYIFNLNHTESRNIAEYDLVFFDRVYYPTFQEACFTVDNVLDDNSFKSFDFSIGDFLEERKAYEKAARYYNSLVPESEAIPLF